MNARRSVSDTCASRENDSAVAASSGEAAFWPAVLSIALGAFALVTAEFLPASLLTPMATDLAISEGLAGQTITATAAIAAAAGPLIVVLTSRFNRRYTLCSLTALLIVSTICAASATGLAMLLVSRVLLGVALGGFWAMAGALAMRLVSDRLMPRAMALVNTGILAAMVCSGPVGAWMGDRWGWRMVFAATAVVGGAALLAQLLTVPSLPPSGRATLGTFAMLLRRRTVGLGLVVIGLVVSAHFAGFTYIRPFLEQVPALNADTVSIVLFAFGFGGLLGNFAGGVLAERNERMAVGFSAIAIAGTAAMLAIFGASMTVAIVATALWGFAFGALPVGLQTWMTRAAPDHAESAGGLLLTSYQLAIASGAVLGGLLVDGIGARGPITYCAAAALVGSLVALADLRGAERIRAN